LNPFSFTIYSHFKHTTPKIPLDNFVYILYNCIVSYETLLKGGVMEILSALKQLFLFRNTDVHEIDAATNFTDKCIVKKYTPTSVLQSPDRPLDAIALLLCGKARVYTDSSDSAAILRVMTAGDVFGAVSLYAPAQGYRTVTCAWTECSVLLIPGDTVKMLIQNYHTIAENYICFLSDRIRFLNSRITAFTAGTAHEKLAVYLLSLPADDGDVLKLNGSLSTLANALNMGRASLYRAIEFLEEHRILEKNGKSIRILDRNALQNICAHPTQE